MTRADIVAIFREIDTQDLPDIHPLGSARLHVLWVLLAGKTHGGVERLSPAQIADVLVDCYGISITRQRVRVILTKERETVCRRMIRGREYFSIMKAGVDLFQPSTFDPVFIDPSRALTEIRKVEGVLGDLKGDLRVCDPYVESKTLDLLAMCGRANAIRLLTVNVHKEGRFERDLRAFNLEHGNRLVVRRHPPGVLHDRYVVHEAGALLFGGSLNGLGMKQTFVWPAGPDLSRTAAIYFEQNWKNAQPYP
jgi:hypothetical protein